MKKLEGQEQQQTYGTNQSGSQADKQIGQTQTEKNKAVVYLRNKTSGGSSKWGGEEAAAN